MNSHSFVVEPGTPFSESMIWQLNRDFYIEEGVNAWSSGVVPFHLTSNSMVGKTYAELIFSFLKDLTDKGHTQEKVYIMELGAGHGRLAFHILRHLERMIGQLDLLLPPYCFVISDIVEDNLAFFQNHPQFQDYFEQGILEVAYFDAMGSKELLLRHSQTKILPGELKQPLVVLANYFFDSIPKDLFYIESGKISSCSISLETDEDPEEMDQATLLKKMQIAYHHSPMEKAFYPEAILNEILEDYKKLNSQTYLFFPHIGLRCLQNLQQYSQKGMMVISMDKGYHELHDLENVKEPDMIAHGSMSFWVNYHAYGEYCKKSGGTALFPSSSTFHLELGCFLFLPESESYTEVKIAYERFVNDFGPDDFNSVKNMTYRNVANATLPELMAVLRLSAYDSRLFTNFLPRLKQLAQQITFNQRTRLAQSMHRTWKMYFSIRESYDLAFEIGGLFYSLGFYQEALNYFQFSINLFGQKPDLFYNQALCYYQLREDALFIQTVKEAKAAFPEYDRFEHLDKLDLGAE